jgi:glycosyltransferase involved in cell wall biosynthesis
VNVPKPKLLIVSHVLPFPGKSGQEQRVLQTLRALSPRFHVTFATVAKEPATTESALKALVDDAVVLDSAYPAQYSERLGHKISAGVFATVTGMKTSNYTIGHLELSPERLLPRLQGKKFDCALFEYWHAADVVPGLQAQGVPCVLDMHNVLWQARLAELKGLSRVAPWLQRFHVNRYRRHEENTWARFDGIVAISAGELEYVRSHVPSTTSVFYLPMGINLAAWPFGYRPAIPPRIVYYGGLGNYHNQEGVRRCVGQIMPAVWKSFPEAELWIVGSNPPPEIQSLARDPRIHVTGFVEKPQEILATMSVAVCPFLGRFGFRSRIVEVMSVGVPMVATEDAVFGMGLSEKEALLTGETDAELASHVISLLSDAQRAGALSRCARSLVEREYSVEATYGTFGRTLFEWMTMRDARPAKSELEIAAAEANG